MNLFKLSFSYIRRRALNSFLNVLLLSFGISTVVVLLLFNYQFEENLYNNARGVDVVVGAKGSPIQLILSSVFHADSPTGNIRLSEARELMEHPMVESIIPLALGDNYQGYRIVGTTSGYIEHYNGGMSGGTLWDHEFEVVFGSLVAERTGLGLGDTIVSSHGLSEGGHTHDDHDLQVVGILEPTGTVLDRLILTSVETMWAIHDHNNHDDHEEHGHTENHHHDHDGHHTRNNHPDYQDENIIDGHVHEGNTPTGRNEHNHVNSRRLTDVSYLSDHYLDQEITAMLIRYGSPIAAAQFPRYVNAETNMQAAAPGFEITRMLNLLGMGLDAIEVFAYILILAAILGIFIALLNSMRDRKYDLAIMRTLGGSRTKLFLHIMSEGVIIALAGGLLGMVLGHLAVEGIGRWVSEAQQFSVTGSVIIPGEGLIILLSAGIGIIASIVPALQAYRTDIAETLSKA